MREDDGEDVGDGGKSDENAEGFGGGRAEHVLEEQRCDDLGAAKDVLLRHGCEIGHLEGLVSETLGYNDCPRRT